MYHLLHSSLLTRCKGARHYNCVLLSAQELVRITRRHENLQRQLEMYCSSAFITAGLKRNLIVWSKRCKWRKMSERNGTYSKDGQLKS